MLRKPRELTNEELQSSIWQGRKTGNLFKVTKILAGPPRLIQYQGTVKNGKTFQLEYPAFATRFKPATDTAVWEALTNAATDGEDQNLLTLIEPDARHDLSKIILAPDAKLDIFAGINRIVKKDLFEATWHLSQIEPRANRAALGFYGPPGTGKTLTAAAVAKTLGKKLLQVDYSQIISKYPGDTAKHIKAAFETARAEKAVIFWDEADALVSRRIDLTSSTEDCNPGINQNRAALLTALDRFDGVAIFATNLFQNYDEAFLRRIAQHVEFKLPDAPMRLALYKQHLPANNNTSITGDEWKALADRSKGLSGGDILNVTLNAINLASLAEDPADWKLTYDLMLCQVHAILHTKLAHSAALPEHATVKFSAN